MSYSATVRRLLISCPSDVPGSDLAVVHKRITRWNGIYGQRFAAAVLPISWGNHAASEFGRHPQEILNDQLVDECDIGLAIFANRLGTETVAAESGTVEEIERLHNAGRYVAILRSTMPVNTDNLDLDQVRKLQEYLTGIAHKALVLGYSTYGELEDHVDVILPIAVSRDAARAELQMQSANAEVWPRVGV